MVNQLKITMKLKLLKLQGGGGVHIPLGISYDGETLPGPPGRRVGWGVFGQRPAISPFTRTRAARRKTSPLRYRINVARCSSARTRICSVFICPVESKIKTSQTTGMVAVNCRFCFKHVERFIKSEKFVIIDIRLCEDLKIKLLLQMIFFNSKSSWLGTGT